MNCKIEESIFNIEFGTKIKSVNEDLINVLELLPISRKSSFKKMKIKLTNVSQLLAYMAITNDIT